MTDRQTRTEISGAEPSGREPPPSFLPPYWDAAAPAPRFAMGKRVRVRRLAPMGHYRAPFYIRGASGVVERVCGHFRDPQELAYGRGDGPKSPLYRVRFALSELWPADAAAYGREDTLDVELYESWLEPFFDYDDLPAASARLEAELKGGGDAS